MSRSQFHSIKLFILRHAWLNLWDKHMTTGRINQVTLLSTITVRQANHQTSVQRKPPFLFSFTHDSKCFHSLQREIIDKVKYVRWADSATPDSLALSIFHYTDDDRADTMQENMPRRGAYEAHYPKRELCNSRAWGKQSNITPSSRG